MQTDCSPVFAELDRVGLVGPTRGASALGRLVETCRPSTMLDQVTVPCQDCGAKLASDSPELRLELADDDEPVVYCLECWEREFGDN